IASPGPTTKPGTRLRDRRASSIVDPELGDETERRRAEPACPKDAWQEPGNHDLTRPRSQAAGSHCADEDGKDSIRVAEKVAANRPPLGFVRVEEPLGDRSADGQCKLPAEIPRVLDPGVHPLRTDRAVDVRGIAGQEHTIAAVVSDLPVVQSEVAQPERVA